MKVAEGGKEHRAGDPKCPACYSPPGEHWPQRHRDAVSNCQGLVHAEMFPSKLGTQGAEVLHHCDVCGANPI